MVDDEGRRGKDSAKPERASETSVISNKDQRGGFNFAGATVHVDGDIVQGDTRRSADEAGPWSPSPSIGRYLDWLAAQEHRVPMRGVGGGELSLTLKQTYVSLGLAVTPAERGAKSGRERHLVASDGRGFGISRLFARLGEERSKHALILGEPGSGKSTALRKLGQLVAEQARRARGDDLPVAPGLDAALLPDTLGERYLPVFVHLREWRDDDDERPIAEFIRRELLKSTPPLDDEVVDALWEHGDLVLLLDGLDEVTVLERRAQLCQCLASQLVVPAHSRLRVVLTCRNAGYDEAKLRLGARGFGRAALQPLSKEQAELLIWRWFEEVARTDAERLSPPRARCFADGLTRALEHSSLGDYRRAMFATPLIVTLLCVLYLRGKTLPHSRAELYSLCLEVLLGSWHQGKDDGVEIAGEAPFTPRQAIELLRPLAYQLHTTEDADRPERSEQIERDVLLAVLMDGLADQGLDVDEEDALQWLHVRAGVLDELAPGSFGFFHLGVQEYLTARAIEHAGEAALHELAGRVGDSWWSEVILIAASLQGGSFAPLIEGLLERADLGDPKQWARVRECVVEGCFDPQPFIARLTAETLDSAPRLVAILRLLEGRKGLSAGLAASLESLAGREGVDEDARGLAAQLVANAAPSADGEPTYDVAVVCFDDALQGARALLRQLRQDKSLRVWPGQGRSPALAGIEVRTLRTEVKAVVVVVGDMLPWTGETSAAKAKLHRLTRRLGFTVVRARGSSAPDPRATLPEKWRLNEVLDMRDAWDIGALKEHLRSVATPTATTAVTAATAGVLIARVRTPSVEPTTGIRLLWVPGGTFMMGSDEIDDDSRPPHLVRVEPFWIGETPVTNQQYRAFVEATGHREPRAWRRRGFNDPQQPVVTVSWEDADAFCRWLRERSGWAFDLPSEAQWEFAARGEDGRPYPWGREKPDATRAHFDQGMDGRPAIVGSYPAGEGPYGALDQAGNVWEWCKDVWDADAYKRRARPPEVNSEEVVRTGDAKSRSLRGGSWYHGSGALAAACRLGNWHDYDLNDFGFRVLVSREP